MTEFKGLLVIEARNNPAPSPLDESATKREGEKT